MKMWISRSLDKTDGQTAIYVIYLVKTLSTTGHNIKTIERMAAINQCFNLKFIQSIMVFVAVIKLIPVELVPSQWL